jgi:ribosome-associated protein
MSGTPRRDEASSDELALTAAEAADAKKADDIVLLDVGAVLAITDIFIVASAPNTRLVRTVAEEIERLVKERHGVGPLRVEGIRDLQWVLLDYGDVVVHVFTSDTRRFYDIERLYRDVPQRRFSSASTGR